ncbi:MAG: PilZ domain-containing protein [Candidatus Caenarcaniphilales bacterium]|nr:PilZ domain-containing protein [Candidatus Caenarcaniphilales bacterium]
MNSSTQTASNTQATNLLILNKPIIAQFSYLNDCQVKIPVIVREQAGQYYMKNPVKPDPKWQLNVIIRSIDFQEGHNIKLMKTPFGEMEVWESSIIQKMGHSDYAEVYKISRPNYYQIDSGRKSPRIFCLTPVKCLIGQSKYYIKAICVDISDSGFSLRFEDAVDLNIGEICQISFEAPLDNLPSINGKIVRQSTSSLDKSTSVGLVISPEDLEHAQKIVTFMIDRQSKQNTDSFVNTNSFGFQESKEQSLSDMTKSFSKDILSLFSSSNG